MAAQQGGDEADQHPVAVGAEVDRMRLRRSRQPGGQAGGLTRNWPTVIARPARRQTTSDRAGRSVARYESLADQVRRHARPAGGTDRWRGASAAA